MNEKESVQYDSCRNRLDRIYEDIVTARAEFRDLVSQMAAVITAEQGSS